MARATKTAKTKTAPTETDLYRPVKKMLEGQGYEVKGEVGSADVVAMREGDEMPVIVELKTGFTLSLFHQACERLVLTPHVYVAVPHLAGRRFYKSLLANRKLCRRLGIGLITVRLSDKLVQLHCDPKPYAPRKAPRKTAALLQEFAKRMGDPNLGGSTKRILMTAYRQDALRCLLVIKHKGQAKAAHIACDAGVSRARQIMADNHYGWFARVERGIYGLGGRVEEAFLNHGEEMEQLAKTLPLFAENDGLSQAIGDENLNTSQI